MKAIFEFDPKEKLFSPPLKTLLTLAASMGFAFLANMHLLRSFSGSEIPPIVDVLVTGLLLFRASKLLGDRLDKLTE